jgi:hypothetical protein
MTTKTIERQDNIGATFEGWQDNSGATFEDAQSNIGATFKDWQDNRSATFKDGQDNSGATFAKDMLIKDTRLPDAEATALIAAFSKDRAWRDCTLTAFVHWLRQKEEEGR